MSKATECAHADLEYLPLRRSECQQSTRSISLPVPRYVTSRKQGAGTDRTSAAGMQ